MRLRSLPEWGMHRSPSSIGVLIGVVRAHEETDVGSLLPPWSRPTQVGTTPGLAFRTLLFEKSMWSLR